jgi:flagellar hook-length control protein FliK
MSAATPAPQSSLPADTATGDGQSATMAFVEQLSKLLQPATLTTQSGPPEAVAAQPVPPSAVAAQPDATPAIASGELQIILPQLPNTALPSQQPDTQTAQPRCVSNNKPKVESATPRRRAGVTADQPAAPTMPASLTPDAIASPPVAPPATRERTAQHEPARDQHSNQQAATSGPPPASSALQQLDGPNPSMSGMDQQQPQDPSPMQVALMGPPDASATVMPPAAPQPEIPSVRSAETTTAPAPMSHASSPAAQIAPALMQTSHAADGAQRLTVRLDPPELGHVQVKIDRPSDAPARVEITVQKQETLTLLLRDQPQLQRALDQAGVPADGRTVTFHIAASGPSMRTDPGTMPVPGTAAGGLTGDGSQGAARQHGQSARPGRDTTDEDEAEFTPIAARGWLRAGLDITA